MDEFVRRYQAGEPQVLSETLVADLDTPVSAYLKLVKYGGVTRSSVCALTLFGKMTATKHPYAVLLKTIKR